MHFCSKLFKGFTAYSARHTKMSAFVLGAISALAMAPTFYWPLMMVGLSGLFLLMGGIERPWKCAWTLFFWGMGYFTFSLYWIANALLMKLDEYWWLIGFSIFGLPLILSMCWFVAGYVLGRLSKPKTMARMILLVGVLLLAEYGRAFNLSGFPWNLFGYMWGAHPALMQSAALGGAYFTTALSLIWMATPALIWQARARRAVALGIALISGLSFVGFFAWGAERLTNNPTQLRDDYAVAIIQPNLSQDEKWETDQELEHYMRHIVIAHEALAKYEPPKTLKGMAMIWPETSLIQDFVYNTPQAARALERILGAYPYSLELVSGIWRSLPNPTDPSRPKYYNSIGSISLREGRLSLDTLYDKHHLVPFGEYLPMEQLLNLTPVVGFAGFQWGDGPKTLTPPALPAFAPMICFEAIFPWYAKSEGAAWLVNTSNDGWYGNAPGPYQHLTMSRYRALEQGKPLARSATTGISALIDGYGRVLESLPYSTRGAIISALPKVATQQTLYTKWGETLFFALIGFVMVIYTLIYNKDI